MFLTIGFIIGFAAGWYVNEKFEDLAGLIGKLKFWKKQMFKKLKSFFDKYVIKPYYDYGQIEDDDVLVLKEEWEVKPKTPKKTKKHAKIKKK